MSKTINGVQNNLYLGNCLETTYFWRPKRKAASEGKLDRVVQIDVYSFMIQKSVYFLIDFTTLANGVKDFHCVLK